MSENVTSLDVAPPVARTSAPPEAPAPLPKIEIATGPGSAATATLAGRLEQAVANLVILRVTTVVGTITAEQADQLHQVTALTLNPAGQQVASTSVNMLLGDCSTLLAPIFVENAVYKDLHAAGLAKALEIRGQTIGLLKEAYEAFKEKLPF